MDDPDGSDEEKVLDQCAKNTGLRKKLRKPWSYWKNWMSNMIYLKGFAKT